MGKINQFLKDTKGELRHVSWPTKKQTTIFTVVVIVVSLILGYFMGLFDFIFSEALKVII